MWTKIKNNDENPLSNTPLLKRHKTPDAKLASGVFVNAAGSAKACFFLREMVKQGPALETL